MRDFITFPDTPTFANPSCRPELHPPDWEEWEREVQPVIDWILAGCHLAPFDHPLVAKRKREVAQNQSPPRSVSKPYRDLLSKQFRGASDGD